VSNVRENITNNIIKYRKLSGLLQKELGEKVGVASTSVSSWERGANSPDVETLVKLCDIFGITINEMYGEEPKQQETTLLAAHYEGKDLLRGMDKDQINDIMEFIKYKKSQKK